MITSISIKNFQSHNNTKLELVNGINTIIGASNRGKSAVMRALYWAINNKPTGDSFISHWAKDEKGKIIKPCSVTITKDTEKIKRKRDNDFNGYILDNGEKLKALKGEVPEQINSFFNLGEVNIQKQMDSPFLISNSAGEVARFFNKVIKLDDIDTILQHTESKKRAVNKDIEFQKTVIEEKVTALDSLKWVDTAKPLIEKLDKLEGRKADKIIDLNELVQSIETYNIQFKKLKDTEKLLSVENKIKKVVSVMEAGKVLRQKENDVVSSIDSYKTLNTSIIKYNSLLKIDKMLIKAQKEISEIETLRKSYEELEETIEDYELYSNRVIGSSKEIKQFKKQLPAICPTCNQPFKGDK